MIENNIHQIWVGPNKIPNHIKNFCDDFRENNKNHFRYYFWESHHPIELPNQALRFYNKQVNRNPALACDVLRVFVIYHYGGFYFDTDCESVSPLINLKIPKESTGWLTSKSETATNISNTIFGFGKHHPFLKFLIHEIETIQKPWFGPSWWADSLNKYLGLDYKSKNILTLNAAKKHNIFFTQFGTDSCFLHHPLASWLPKYRRKIGTIS